MKKSLVALCAALTLALVQDTEKRPALPEIGKPAPTFRLNHHEGEPVAVGGPQRHWTVLAFFPKAMTPG